MNRKILVTEYQVKENLFIGNEVEASFIDFSMKRDISRIRTKLSKESTPSNPILSMSESANFHKYFPVVVVNDLYDGDLYEEGRKRFQRP